MISTMWSFAQDDNSADYSLEGLSRVCLNCSSITPFDEGVAIIIKDEKKGVIDKMGNIVVPIEYDDIYELASGNVRVIKGEMEGIIDNKGNMITPLHKPSTSTEIVLVDSTSASGPNYQFHEGLAVIYKDNKVGYINEKGIIVVSPKYDDANDFHEGLAVVAVKSNNSFNYGYIDKTGKEVIPCQFCDASAFSEGFAIARKEFGPNYCFYNTKGEKAFDTVFYQCRSFKEGVAIVQNDEGKSGFINHSGEMVIPYSYDYISDFSEGLAIVMEGGKLGYIDKQGRCTLDF